MNPPPAKTRHSVVAGFFPKRVNELTQNPPPRHENQQGSVSARTKRLVRLYQDELEARFAERTAGEYMALIAAADTLDHPAVGVLLESCLADKMAFAERTKRLIREHLREKVHA